MKQEGNIINNLLILIQLVHMVVGGGGEGGENNLIQLVQWGGIISNGLTPLIIISSVLQR